jgi:hypothetical protein
MSESDASLKIRESPSVASEVPCGMEPATYTKPSTSSSSLEEGIISATSVMPKSTAPDTLFNVGLLFWMGLLLSAAVLSLTGLMAGLVLPWVQISTVLTTRFAHWLEGITTMFVLSACGATITEVLLRYQRKNQSEE